MRWPAALAVLAALLPVGGVHAAGQTPAPSAIAGAPDTSRQVPRDHWAYASLDSLLHPGRITVGYPNSADRSPALTRREFAVATARLLARYGFLGDSPGRTTLTLPALGRLRALVREFEPELRERGVDPNRAVSRLEALLKGSFADVPEGHWAHSSVEAVRQHGLMVGFPDGRFYGSR